MMQPFHTDIDEATIRRERDKARKLRDSAWWKNQLGRGRCAYCLTPTHPSQLTMDHKRPIARGGRSERSNLVPVCKDCNTEKKYLTLPEFTAERQKQGRPLAYALSELS